MLIDCSATAAIGRDIQETSGVRRTYATFGARYLRRVLHPSELACAASIREPARLIPFLAGRFAAKEALYKTFGARDTDALPWRDIEIVSSSSGPRAVLHRAAKALADRGGLRTFSVSISHVPDFAIATAIAMRPPLLQTTHHIDRKAGTQVTDANIDERIRAILAAHARIDGDASTLAADDDLYAAGMSSHASVTVMLALEDEFDIEFPEAALTKSTFASIESIHSEVQALDVD